MGFCNLVFFYIWSFFKQNPVKRYEYKFVFAELFKFEANAVFCPVGWTRLFPSS
jgi:hypothetical protein